MNCSLALSGKEGLIRPREDLIDAAERGLSADYLVLLLSPDSVPDAWLRVRWERVLVEEAREFGTQVAYVLLRSCKFPAVFRQKAFFDLSEHRLAGQRAVRRWLLRQDPFFETAVIDLPELPASAKYSPEALGGLECRLVDQAGVEADVAAELALTFSHMHAEDFQGVFWLNGCNRSRAGTLGDIAERLRLKLRGTLEQNALAIREFCAERRLLFIFEHAQRGDRDVIAFGGKTSVIFVAEHERPPPPRSLEETAAVFSGWRTGFEKCISALGDAHYYVSKLPEYGEECWRVTIQLGSAAFSCLRDAGRLAEAYELLELLISAVRSRDDGFMATRLEWERDWILEEWDAPVPTRTRHMPGSQPVQLSLELDD